MRFVFGKQDILSLKRAQERCWLLTNGLGGYMSTSAAFSVTRWDQGLLTAAVSAPTLRVNLVHRLSEELTVGEKQTFLSTQVFANGTPPEERWRRPNPSRRPPLIRTTQRTDGAPPPRRSPAVR